jgi:hypothetical protein
VPTLSKKDMLNAENGGKTMFNISYVVNFDEMFTKWGKICVTNAPKKWNPLNKIYFFYSQNFADM